MATHSTVPAWRIPGTGEPGGLPSMGSHRVRHDWSDVAAAAADLILTCHQPHCSKQVIRIQPLTMSRNKNHKVIAVKIEKEGKRKVNIKKCKLLRVRIKSGWIFLALMLGKRKYTLAKIFWPPNMKSWLIGKDPDAGKDWGQEIRGQQTLRWFNGITN